MSQSNPVTGLPFSEAVAYNGVLYISGQIGLDPATGSLPDAGFEAEADQAMKNLGRVLHQYGLTYDHLLSVTIYLKSMENYAPANAVYRRYFKDYFPTRTCIAIFDLPLKAHIEISAMAEKQH
jgi:2-iminobutanoate/2-iminopropanoate deaminase